MPNFASGLVRVAPPDKRLVEPPTGRHHAVVQSTEPGGAMSVFDGLGLLIKEIWPDGTSSQWAYDANANTRLYIDREGSQYRYDWTSWNLLERETDPLGLSTRYQYTAYEKLAAVIDAGGTRTDYTYDLRDRVAEVCRHGVTKEAYCYDLADNITAKMDDKGTTLFSCEFAANNLKTSERPASGESHSFQYDEKSRIVLASTERMAVAIAYDKLDNRIQDLRDGLGTKHRFEQGLVAETTVLDRFATLYTYESDGSVLLQDPSGKRHRLQILEGGLVCRTMSNGVSEVGQYDPSGRCLLRAISSESQSHVRTIEYDYTPEGNLRETNDSEIGRTRYRYDDSHRLSSITLPNNDIQHIVYDKAGNLLQKPGLSDVVMADGNRLTNANGDRFAYDDRGRICQRQTVRGTFDYHYDAKGLLTRIDAPDGPWQACYDAFGRRTSKSSARQRVDFYWDGNRLAAERSQDGAIRIYVYPSEFAIVPLLFIDYTNIEADPTSGLTFCVSYNQIGTPMLVTDEHGRTIWRATFEPYGLTQIGEAPAFHMPLRFPGQYLDVETGLHYNRYRYYSPELGRYLQPDPVGLVDGHNLYAYTRDPLVEIDFLAWAAGEGVGPGGQDADAGATAVRVAVSIVCESLPKNGCDISIGHAALFLSCATAEQETFSSRRAARHCSRIKSMHNFQIRIDRIPGRSLVGGRHPSTCAEFKAANDALHAGRPQTRITDLEVYTIRGKDAEPYGLAGEPYPRCRNCRSTLRGARILSE